MRAGYCVIFCACVLSVVGIAGETPPATLSDIGKITKPACVLVETAEGTGSGFCIEAAGLFITNAHVVDGVAAGETVKVVVDPSLPTQKILKAKVIRFDKEMDLALLQSETRQALPVLALGSEEGLSELVELVAFGFPFGKAFAVEGRYPAISANLTRISAMRRDAKGNLERIQVDASLNPGNSGGPVVDRMGKVAGVVVGGIPGTGINLIIPVSHVNRFMTSPVIFFSPPEITAANRHELVEFAATVTLAPSVKTPVELELVLASAGGKERRLPMRKMNDVYSIKAVPYERTMVGTIVRVDAAFEDGAITGLSSDRDIKVGERSIKLSEIRRIRPGTKGEVELTNGQVIEGAVSGIESVVLKFGGQSAMMKLDSATEIKIKEPEVNIKCTIVARQAGKVVGQREYVLGDGVATLVDQEMKGAGAGGAAAGGAEIKAGDPSGLEALLEGKFGRPRAAARPVTYLKVLSTAGDFIGQGKRYEYTKDQLIVDAAQGLVSVRVDSWNLEIAPGRGQLLKPGEYPNAKRYPFNDTMPGLNFSGNGRGSNTLSGKFVVWELKMRGAEVAQLAIDFIQRSEGTGPPLVGKLRINSSLD